MVQKLNFFKPDKLEEVSLFHLKIEKPDDKKREEARSNIKELKESIHYKLIHF